MKHLFCVASKETEEHGWVAYYLETSIYTNLASFASCYDTFNICSTKKYAKDLAQAWNDNFINLGKQW